MLRIRRTASLRSVLSHVLIAFAQSLDQFHPLAFLTDFFVFVFDKTRWTGRTTRSLLRRMSPTFHHPCQMVSYTEIEGHWFELDLATCDFGPLISCSVDPANEIEVIDAF